jgi:acyl-coenzyme A synthetase/AMP-(fatty) acid ligase
LGHELQFSIDEFDWTKQWALYSPQNVAYRDADTDVSWTWSEVYRLSCSLAKKLSENLGLVRGDRDALLAGGHPALGHGQGFLAHPGPDADGVGALA